MTHVARPNMLGPKSVTDSKAGCLYPNNARVLREARAKGFDNALVRDFPNITAVDTSATVAQVQQVLGQVIRAVEFLFGFTLTIISSHFSGKSRIMRHQIIYQALQDLIPARIHALSIAAYAPDEHEPIHLNHKEIR